MKINLILLCFCVFVSCVKKTNNQELYESQKIIKDSVLNSLNTEKLVVINSPRYKKIIKDSSFRYSFNNRAELSLKFGTNKFEEKLNHRTKDDLVEISYYFYICCTDQVIPYIKTENSEIIDFDFYELSFSELVFEENSTEYQIRSEAISLETIGELIIQIKSNMIGTRQLTFKGKPLTEYQELIEDYR